jgi:geranylgeranyl transferase type-2 subunit alpha
MHGRLKIKTSKEQEEERKIKEREKAYHFQHLTKKLFDLRPQEKTPEVLDECFKLTNELLMINPDFYTVWNIRKECILKFVELSDQDETIKCLKDELSFTLSCLKKNEKSYSVWQHRIWCLSKLPQSEYYNEIMLCNMFLTKDERNFHCWDYRNYISDIAKTDLKSEFDFTTEKINSNFSNFSAWHRRHKLLLRGLSMPEGECPSECDLRKIWVTEHAMILNALYTDPSDQSPWLYHNWLIKNNFNQLTDQHIKDLEELQSMEPDNRWVKQAIVLAKRHLNAPQSK